MAACTTKVSSIIICFFSGYSFSLTKERKVYKMTLSFSCLVTLEGKHTLDALGFETLHGSYEEMRTFQCTHPAHPAEKLLE